MDNEKIIKDFFDAIYNNDLKTIIEMITNNLVDINDVYNEYGEPPLVYAVKVNKPEVLILLLTNDADINIRVKNTGRSYIRKKEHFGEREGFTALTVAFEWNNINCMIILLNYKPDILSSRYKGASFVNKWICYFAELHELFNKEKSSKFEDSFNNDIKNKLKEINMKYKFDGKLDEKNFFTYDELMIEAIAKNNFNLFLQLLRKKGNDIYLTVKLELNYSYNVFLYPIFFIAIYFNNKEVIEYLMKEGFNINDDYDIINSSSIKVNLSSTPLIFAIGYKKNDIAKYLIDNGADINKTTSIYLEIFYYYSNTIGAKSTFSAAVKTCNYEMIHLLVDMGYDISKEYKK